MIWKKNKQNKKQTQKQKQKTKQNNAKHKQTNETKQNTSIYGPNANAIELAEKKITSTR